MEFTDEVSLSPELTLDEQGHANRLKLETNIVNKFHLRQFFV